MYCRNCNNLLEKRTTSRDEPDFLCLYCGSLYAGTPDDSLIYNEDKKRIAMPKKGDNIYHLPANQKVRVPCPKCKATIVAWELNEYSVKTYGCRCGHSWEFRLALS